MRKWIFVGVSALVAACSSSQPPRAPEQASAPTEPAPVVAAAPRPGLLATGPVSGEVLAYSTQLPRRHSGATTWWPVQFSAREVLAASGPQGRLRLRAPSGEVLSFRHVQSQTGASGQRIWLGQAEPDADGHGDYGRQAVLVFGEGRVVGRIDQPGRAPLHLATDQGRTWLVESEAMDAAGPIQAQAVAGTPSDYLMPPAALPPDPAVGGAEDERASADLVIGYTKGFAARFDAPGGGGRAELAMYLDLLATNINAALNLSKVNSRTRIVRTVEVDYSDTTDDLQALRELTGADGVAVHPAFAELRRARDTYGGDAVFLVRKYSGAQGGRCGAAWMIGGNRTGVDRGDSALAYSVFNWDLGAYFCTERNMAHLFGHSLGLQHDRASASPNGGLDYGAFDDSFGYVSGPASDARAIRTAMSYPVESPQYRGLYSTAEGKCYEQTCGVAGQADNARAARQTFPILASFRPKKVRGGATRGDFDMNGGAELYWRNPGSQEFALWTHALPTGARGFSMVMPYEIAAIADFTGDGRSDVLWKSDADHYLVLWVAKDQGYEQRAIGGYEPGMSFVGAGDFDGDERYDLAWRSTVTGQLKLWLMRGETIAATRVAPMPGWFDILGIGDFSDKGYSDIVYADASDVNLYVNDGSAFRGVRVNARPAGWAYAGSADMDSDGRDDMLWVNDSLKTLSYWLMDGQRILGNPALYYQPGERLVAARQIGGRAGAELIWDYAGSASSTNPPFVKIDTLPERSSVYHPYPWGWKPQ